METAVEKGPTFNNTLKTGNVIIVIKLLFDHSFEKGPTFNNTLKTGNIIIVIKLLFDHS